METNGKISTVQLAARADLSVSASIGIPEWWPSGHRAGVVLAHGLGTDMNDELLVQLQQRLMARGFLSIRFNFPFAEQGRKRPDPPALLERTFKLALHALLHDPEQAPALLVFGGFGLGARVAGDVIASGQKADGLLCLGYPLHPAGKPSQAKADALFRIICPILFVQGSRDAHCRLDRLDMLRRRIGAPTRVAVIEDADHTLAPIKRSSKTSEEIAAEVLGTVEAYLERTLGA